MIKKGTLLLITMLAFALTGKSQHQIGYASVNGTKLYYEITGKGTPIVFIHGIFSDTRNWKYQTDFFSKKYKVICYDGRGYGRSDLPDSIHPFYQYEDLKCLLDYLKIKKAIVVGHSMGGVTAMDFAVHYPERVIALILAEGSSHSEEIWGKTSDVSEQLRLVWKILAEQGIEAGQKAFLEIPMIQISLKNNMAAEIIRKMTTESPGWKWHLHNKKQNYLLESLEILKKFQPPTLVLYGEYSPDLYFKAMSKVAETIPNAKLLQIKGSSHCLNLENPDDFNKAIANFLTDSKP